MLTDLLDELAPRHRVPGAQLAVRRDGVTTTAVTGPVEPDSAFPLGSLTKPFTAALALALVADGDLDLDESPWGRHPGVTLRRLLSHTAGFESNVDDTASSRRKWVSHRLTAPTEFPPGTVFSYSNVGYVLVGHLVEDVLRTGWSEALRSIVLAPLGITPGFVIGPRGPRPVVSGHVVTADRVVPAAEQVMPEVEAPNGALALSATDLVTFAGGSEMCQDQLAGIAIGPYGMADGWGLGWARYGSWFGHDGTGDGTSCHLRFDPATGTAVALTTNGSTGAALWHDIVAALELPFAATENPTEEPGPADAVGRYANGEMEFVVTDADGRLWLDAGDRPVPLTCRAGLRFTVPLGPVPLGGRFLRGDNGIELVQVTGRLARRSGGRR